MRRRSELVKALPIAECQLPIEDWRETNWRKSAIGNAFT
jgi:hypothetical protein